jgi:hypothetical protein
MVIRKSPKTAWRTIAGEGVILDLDSKMLRGLNPAGTRIWELIDGQRSVDGIVEQIAGEFDVDPARAQADTESFIRELLAKQLVEVVQDEHEHHLS